MIGRGIGTGFATARDSLARGLIRLGVTPNFLTILGIILTSAAAVCYALAAGRDWAWSLDITAPANALLLVAGVLMVLSSACDMLDGAVARLGAKSTPFGAFLDSTLDRYSDFAVYGAIAVYYARQSPANVTFVLLSMLAVFNSFMISYTKARAEDIIDSCRVGYWQRGERSAAILIATFAHNVPALLTQQALLPMLTVIRRILYTRAVINGKKPVTDPRKGPLLLKLRLWRWPRATIPYDFVTGVNIAWLIFAAPINAYWYIRGVIFGRINAFDLLG